MATLSELKAELAMYKEAERAIILGAQQYEIAGRKVTKASLPVVLGKIAELEMRIAMFTGSARGVAVFGGRR